MESGDMRSWIITNFAFEFWDIRGHLGMDKWPGGIMSHRVIHQFRQI